jgi:hypothetical protein
LIIQRAIEDAFDAWLGRARNERRPDSQHGLRNYEIALADFADLQQERFVGWDR